LTQAELDSSIQGSIKLVRGCPCYKVFGDEKLCVNADSVLEISVIDIDPYVFAFHKDKQGIEQERAPDGDVCYAAIYVNYPDNRVYCISQGWMIRIHGKDVPGNDLEEALQFLSTKDLSASAEICSECLYKFLLTLSDVFADMMTRKEKTEEIKRYVDKFSLKIAVKLSQMDELMKPIGTESDIEQTVDHFAFLRGYLVQLLEQQGYWSNLGRELQESRAEPWVKELVSMRERLSRLEFQFYSQTLQVRDISDFHMLIRMLHFILRTSDEILALNQKIHTEIRSQRFKQLAEKDQRLAHLQGYAEKSRTVEHNFGNILQILSRL
jgi:transcription initiation factor TFIIIB Brf1 subunit/transcription initiation factor TFIIB